MVNFRSRAGLASVVTNIFKSLQGLSTTLYGLEEHVQGPNPETMFAIEGAVENHGFLSFAVMDEFDHLIFVAFEVAVLAFPKRCLGH